MTARVQPAQSTVHGGDGTVIGFHTLGHGPGLLVVGGVLCTGLEYVDVASSAVRSPDGPGEHHVGTSTAALTTQSRNFATGLGGLPSPVEADAIWNTIWLEEAHNSTALEGNTLVLRQVERLLADGMAVGNKELKEYTEVRG